MNVIASNVNGMNETLAHDAPVRGEKNKTAGSLRRRARFEAGVILCADHLVKEVLAAGECIFSQGIFRVETERRSCMEGVNVTIGSEVGLKSTAESKAGIEMMIEWKNEQISIRGQISIIRGQISIRGR